MCRRRQPCTHPRRSCRGPRRRRHPFCQRVAHTPPITSTMRREACQAAGSPSSWRHGRKRVLGERPEAESCWGPLVKNDTRTGISASGPFMSSRLPASGLSPDPASVRASRHAATFQPQSQPQLSTRMLPYDDDSECLAGPSATRQERKSPGRIVCPPCVARARWPGTAA